MTTNSQQAVTEAMVTAAMSAYDTVSADPVMIHCASCKGSGQVAVGDSPDWCSSCGGGGFDLAPGEELRPMRAALEAALSAQAQAKPVEMPGGWQDISTVPRDGRDILLVRVAEGKRPIVRVDHWSTDEKWFGQFNMRHWPPTHWMPLPAAPEPKP